MRKRLKSALNYAAVIAAIMISIFVVKNIPIESILKGKEEPVTLAMTENGLLEDYIGRPAGDDIPRIEDVQTWEDTWQTSCVTIEPIGIISTGIGVRHPWVSAYTNTRRRGRRGGPRRRADVMNAALDVLDEYGEYYLLRLPDESYILAQMSVDDARKIKAGKSITLPVGRKAPVNSQVLANIKALCREYDVNTKGVFYCVDDKWNEEHSTMILFIRIGMTAVMTIVVAVVLIMVIDEFMKKKEPDTIHGQV